MQRDTELLVGATTDIPEAKFITRMVDDAVAPCIINKLPDQELEASDTAKGLQMVQQMTGDVTDKMQAAGRDTIHVLSGEKSGFGTRGGSFPQAVNTPFLRLKMPKTGSVLRRMLKNLPFCSAKASFVVLP